jgi:hypothetical protein
MHHLQKALEAFIKVGKKYNILGKSKQEIIEMYGMLWDGVTGRQGEGVTRRKWKLITHRSLETRQGLTSLIIKNFIFRQYFNPLRPYKSAESG